LKIFHHREDLAKEIGIFRKKGKSIGFVPTMGSLHKGHMSLIHLANEQCDVVVCSIFVNPTQFNDPLDYQLYPKHIDTDTALLQVANCDLLYLPDVNDVYPQGINKESYPINSIGSVLEGKYRPGHFDGVIEVVKRLFEIVDADRAYFGMKDYQQLAVIRWMVKHFKMNIEIIGGPIIRSDSGLALSSRNERLSQEELKSALKLSKSLFYVQDNYKEVDFNTLRKQLVSSLEEDENIQVEYFELANAIDLQPISNFQEAKSVGVFLAAQVGKVRLIDNVVLF